jgi:hypothetical protein
MRKLLSASGLRDLRLVRRQTLYPTELRAHGAIYFTIKHLQLLPGKLQF